MWSERFPQTHHLVNTHGESISLRTRYNRSTHPTYHNIQPFCSQVCTQVSMSRLSASSYGDLPFPGLRYTARYTSRIVSPNPSGSYFPRMWHGLATTRTRCRMHGLPEIGATSIPTVFRRYTDQSHRLRQYQPHCGPIS